MFIKRWSGSGKWGGEGTVCENRLHMKNSCLARQSSEKQIIQTGVKVIKRISFTFESIFRLWSRN
jgi:hypothetical protein